MTKVPGPLAKAGEIASRKHLAEALEKRAMQGRGGRRLKLIARELRDYASRAHGDPPTVQITRATLLQYAEEIEKRADVHGE
jgi:hypothetical protein